MRLSYSQHFLTTWLIKKTVLAFTDWLLWRNRTMKMVNVQKEREKSPRFDDKTSISSRKDNKIDEFRPATYSR
jgi:hypothetical protein